MMSRFMQRWVCRASAALAAVLIGSTTNAQALEPIKVRLDWTPWGVHAAVHLAQQRGWFTQGGAGREPGGRQWLGHHRSDRRLQRQLRRRTCSTSLHDDRARQGPAGQGRGRLCARERRRSAGSRRLRHHRPGATQGQEGRLHRRFAGGPLYRRLPGGGQAQTQRPGTDQRRRRQQSNHLCRRPCRCGLLHHSVLSAGGVAEASRPPRCALPTTG